MRKRNLLIYIFLFLLGLLGMHFFYDHGWIRYPALSLCSFSAVMIYFQATSKA